MPSMSTAVLFKVVFGEPLKDAMKKGDGWKIPILIHKATDYIKSKVTVASGVFKTSASKWKVQKLKEEFERGAVGLSKYNDPHSVASLLILYLTSLPDPLLSSAQQDSIREAYRTKSTDEFIQILRSTFHKSLLPNKLLIKYLLLFLHHILSNKVDAYSLAAAWAPVFFPPSSPSISLPLPLFDPPTNTKEEIQITEVIIENYSLIWESGDKKGKPTKNSSPTLVPPVTSHSPPPSPSHPSLFPNGDVKEVGIRSPSPVPHKRPNSALSSHSTATNKTKASPIRGSQTSPAPKFHIQFIVYLLCSFFSFAIPLPCLPPPHNFYDILLPHRSTTPSKTNSPSKKRDSTPTKTRPPSSPQPPRKRTPTQPRIGAQTNAAFVKTPPHPAYTQVNVPKSHAPTQELVKSASMLAPAASPVPAAARAAPPPLPVKRPDPAPEPIATPRAPQHAAPHETPRNLQLLVDMDLNASDFRADPHASCAAPGVIAHVAPAHAPTDDSANEESGTGGEEEEGFADDEVEVKNTLVWDEEHGLVFNNRHSGSFVARKIPRLNLELVMPYDLPTEPKLKKAPSKGSAKTGKAKLQTSASQAKATYKKPTNAPAKANNKTLNLPKAEHTRSSSPQPKPRPHSSNGPSRPPPRSLSASSPSIPSLHPSSAPHRLKLQGEDEERKEEKAEEKGEEQRKKEDEMRKKMEDLLAKNKSLEAEILTLRVKSKEDDDKLANEEKNVSFLLSRVEILDKQRMEAVNRIIDEKSHIEKELQVRISSLEAEVMVLQKEVKLTESAAGVKAHTLYNQVLQSEARIALLQTQLDKAYEEIADKDERMAILEDEVIKSVQNSNMDLVVLEDDYQIDTPKPPLNNAPFYYHHPHLSSASSSSQSLPVMNGHSTKQQAWGEASAPS